MRSHSTSVAWFAAEIFAFRFELRLKSSVMDHSLPMETQYSSTIMSHGPHPIVTEGLSDTPS